MPRLFAAISGDTIKASFIKQAVRLRTEALPEWFPDAFGIAWYDGSDWSVKKERLDAEAEGPVASVEGKAIVSHVRPVSMGPLLDENILPFVDSGWAFAHHGFIDRASLIELLDPQNKKALRGTTDSEAYFRLILQEVGKRRDPVMGLTATIYKIEDVGYFTSLNAVLTNGSRLYVLRYVRGNEKKYSLYMTRVDGGTASATSSLSLMRVEATLGGPGYVISTRPVGESSELIPNKVLVIIKEGMDEEIVPL